MSKLRALYSPSKRQIGCVLLAAVYGMDRQVNNVVDAKDWFTSPQDDTVVISGTVEEWRRFAKTKPEDRPGPDFFKKAA